MARAIQGRPVSEAINLTAASKRRAALQIAKTLKSAIANAENNNGLSADNLIVKEAVIDDGPRMRRYWPRSRGMVSPIARRTCHIKIVLSDEIRGKRK